MDGDLLETQAVEAMEAAEESTLLNLPVAGADFFLMKKTSLIVVFPALVMGLKSQKNQRTALSWHFFFVFIFIFGWRGEKTHE